MKLPISWLNDYTDIKDITPKEYVDALTLSGSKVEGMEPLGEEIQNVVVGKIVKKEKHPNADTLWVCQVDLGEEERQIVTGAQNINEGDLVPIAKAPAHLPGGIVIKAGKLRGEPSNGMMCSHEELGLDISDIPGACENGILIFQENYTPGTDVKEILGLNDTVVEFEITSNRPDCLSVIGIARESAATFGREFSVKTPVAEGTGNVNDYVKVTVEDKELCPRYTARAVRNIKIESSPKWMRDRLSACGVRPINNIVDITNYVMLEYNQPMHAFDKDFLKGGEIIVRRAKEGEKITTLDGIERELKTDMLVIADSEKPVAVAGVMGGENSEINENTKEIIFESAMFNGPSVRLTAKALGMRTEASGRYEKGLDPENTLAAVNRACELIELLGAGEVVAGTVDVYGKKAEKVVLPFEPQRINKFLGTDIDTEFMVNALRSLECEVDEKNMTVTPPTFRADLEGFADIAEEVARLYGYNKIESTLLSGDTLIGGKTQNQKTETQIAQTLSMLGCYEILTYTFTHPTSLERLGRAEELEKCIKISNPLGEENSIMRNNTLHSMLEILSQNYSQRNTAVKLFEIGKIYKADKLPLETLANEIKMLTLGAYDTDFFEMKGIVEELFDSLGIKNYYFDTADVTPSYHPGKTAYIYINEEKAGIMGEVHPEVSAKYSLVSSIVAEIELDKILSATSADKSYKAVTRFPAVSRDLAFLVDESVKARDIDIAVKKYAGKTLENIELFDVYRGKQVQEGKKSMAYKLTFRASDRTLNESDITRTMEKLLKMLEKDLGATLR